MSHHHFYPQMQQKSEMTAEIIFSMNSQTCLRQNPTGHEKDITAHSRLGSTYRMQLKAIRAIHNLKMDNGE